MGSPISAGRLAETVNDSNFIARLASLIQELNVAHFENMIYDDRVINPGTSPPDSSQRALLAWRKVQRKTTNFMIVRDLADPMPNTEDPIDIASEYWAIIFGCR